MMGRQDILFSFFHPFSTKDLEGLHDAGLSAELLKAFPGADMKSESFYLYRIRRIGAPAEPDQK
jgi:hypothetical protein